jgi:hypothetical protein
LSLTEKEDDNVRRGVATASGKPCLINAYAPGTMNQTKYK